MHNKKSLVTFYSAYNSEENVYRLTTELAQTITDTEKAYISNVCAFKFKPDRFCDACTHTGVVFQRDLLGIIEYIDCACSAAAKQHARFEKRLREACIPRKYQAAKVTSWINTGRTQQEVDQNNASFEVFCDYLSRLPHYVGQGTGLYIQGDNGTGKTLLACVVLREAIKRGYECRFTSTPELIDKLFERWHAGSVDTSSRAFTDHVKSVTLLVVDDYEKYIKTSKQHAVDYLDVLLRHRIQQCLPTIVTSNVYMECSGGHFRSSTQSLLFEQSIELLFVGTDYRNVVGAGL